MQRPRETLFLGLFFTPAPRYILRLDKYVIHFFSMNLIPVKDQIRHETCCPFLDRFSSLGVGAYCIRPTNRSTRVGAYGIHTTNRFVRVGTYGIRVTNRSVRVGAYGIHTTNRFVRVGTYGIRVTNRSVRVGTYGIRVTNRSVRVGAYCIRPTNRSVRVGAYCIRPTNASAWRRMTDKPGGFWGVCNTPLPIPIKNLIPIY